MNRDLKDRVFDVPENILHKTYKLVNDNLDTILILNKF